MSSPPLPRRPYTAGSPPYHSGCSRSPRGSSFYPESPTSATAMAVRSPPPSSHSRDQGGRGRDWRDSYRPSNPRRVLFERSSSSGEAASAVPMSEDLIARSARERPAIDTSPPQFVSTNPPDYNELVNALLHNMAKLHVQLAPAQQVYSDAAFTSRNFYITKRNDSDLSQMAQLTAALAAATSALSRLSPIMVSAHRPDPALLPQNYETNVGEVQPLSGLASPARSMELYHLKNAADTCVGAVIGGDSPPK